MTPMDAAAGPPAAPASPLAGGAQAVSRGLSVVEQLVILGSATVMVGALVVAMGGAALLGMGLSWLNGETVNTAADTALFLMVWVGGFGASAAVQGRRHLVLGAGSPRPWQTKLSEVLSFVIAAGLTWTLIQFMQQLGPDLLYHKKYAMAGLTVAAALLSLRYLLRLLGADPPPRDEPLAAEGQA